jgi:hypothetical protein
VSKNGDISMTDHGYPVSETSFVPIYLLPNDARRWLPGVRRGGATFGGASRVDGSSPLVFSTVDVHVSWQDGVMEIDGV